MGLFTRISDIMTANFNAILDRVENPERMLVQIIREMEDGLAVARQHAVSVVAAERHLSRELERQRLAAESWRSRAKLALESEREDLAKRALARHLDEADLVQTLEKRHETARAESAEVQAMLRALEERLEQARRQERLVRARTQSAEVRAQFMAAHGIGNVHSPFARFGRLQNRLVELEDDLLVYSAVAVGAGAVGAAEEELTQMERDHRVDAALAALKSENRRE